MPRIEIKIVDSKLEELGIDADIKYTCLNFKANSFHSYWICDNDLIFYVGNEQFICDNTKKNVALLESILKFPQ
jgi:hypothetical protein